jgi:hypothetical protein
VELLVEGGRGRKGDRRREEGGGRRGRARRGGGRTKWQGWRPGPSPRRG